MGLGGGASMHGISPVTLYYYFHLQTEMANSHEGVKAAVCLSITQTIEEKKAIVQLRE